MDIEWAFTKDGQLKLLQARPITTLFPIQPGMLTQPGEKRFLYYDFNICNEATTVSPFTHMDVTFRVDTTPILEPWMESLHIIEDPHQFLFNGLTRQYLNFSY